MTTAPEVMPVDWMGPIFGIRIAISPLDEFDMPMERRGIRASIPTDPRDREEFADNIAANVRATVMYVMTGQAAGAIR